MRTDVVKRFSTVETLLRLLRHRDVVFQIIEAMDSQHANAISESEYYRFIAAYQQGLNKDAAKDISLVFDCENLLQSKILNDRKSAGGITNLWFNTSVIEIFRLCKISLQRPLTKVTLNYALSEMWSIVSDIRSNKLSITPGTEEYRDWTGLINHHIASLLGKIVANISKLQQDGYDFEKDLKAGLIDGGLDTTKEKFQKASLLHRSEIQPLVTFLDKNTRYENGDGVILLLETLKSLFSTYGDLDSQALIVSYQLQYLDLFEPIKLVADKVSVYLRKTEQAIFEHDALESAFSIIRSSYEKTLSHDQRNKYINCADLVQLGDIHPISSIGRLSPFKLDKTPSFLNNVFNELAMRNAVLNVREDEHFIFEESVSRENAAQLRHSLKISRWVAGFEFTVNTDYLSQAYESLRNDWQEFSIPDLVEIGSALHESQKYIVALSDEFRTIEDDKYRLRYRVRYLTHKTETEVQ